MTRWQRSGAAVGLLLMLAYGLPLFVPPAATWPVPPGPDTGLWERVFPGVPAWWVLGRLFSLFTGAGLIAWSIRNRLPLRLGAVAATPPAGANAPPEVTRTAQRAALLLALAHAASGLFASHFNRLAETLYFLFLAAPAGVLLWAEVQDPWRALGSMVSRSRPLLILPLLWLAVSIPTAWRSPKAASLVDTWILVERLDDVAFGHKNVLADSASPGHSNAYMMLEGVSLIGPHGLPLSFTQLQISHFLWAVVGALAIGVIAWTMVGQAAAVIAQAFFLFSQYVLSSAYEPGLILIAPLCAIILLLLVLAVREFRSMAALALFGAAAGFSTTEPSVVLIALPLCALMAYSVSRFSRVPWLVVGVGALSCAAAVLPALPNPAMLTAMARQYTFGHGQLAGAVMVLLGQDSPYKHMDLRDAGQPGPLDVPLGALLAPFATARMPLRLWGDALFDPLGTALMATGLALCALHVTRNRAAVLVLGLLATGLAQAFTSTGDAVSHMRLAATLLPLAIAAAVGFETLRLAFASTLRPQVVATITAAVIVAGGSTIFDCVNPRILPASWLAISLEALGVQEPNADAVFLEYSGQKNLSWLFIDRIAALLPARSLPIRSLSELERLEATPADALRRVYFWSPAMEQDAAVARTICDRWPEAALYTLMDRPGLFRALAASPRGDPWRPALPHERWTVAFCEPK